MYARITAMEKNEDDTRATFACCAPPTVTSPRHLRGEIERGRAVRSTIVTTFNVGTGCLVRLRSSSGRPLLVTRRTVSVPLPDAGAPKDRLVETDRVGASWARRSLPRDVSVAALAEPASVESRGVTLDGDEREEEEEDSPEEEEARRVRTVAMASESLRQTLLRGGSDEARLAAVMDASRRGRTAGLEPCEYVAYFGDKSVAAKALCELSAYAGGEQIARGLRALESDDARLAALEAMPPSVSRRVDGTSLLRSFAGDDRRLDAFCLVADRGSEVMAPALLACFDGDKRRADALRMLPARAVTEYNLAAIVTRFEDAPRGYRLPVFARLARERPGMCSDWDAVCCACFRGSDRLEKARDAVRLATSGARTFECRGGGVRTSYADAAARAKSSG